MRINIFQKVSPSETNGNEEAPPDVSDAVMQSPQQHASIPLSNENVSPEACDCHDESIAETESFCWRQLLPTHNSPQNEWIQCYQSSQPLRMLLSAALDACADKVHRGELSWDEKPSRDVADVRLMYVVWQQMESLQQTVLRTEREKLNEAWRLVDSIRPPSLQSQLAELESEIAVVEKAIAREARALALSRKRKLDRQLEWCQRQEVEWRALSSLLAGNIDFPREDDSGLAHGFPVQKLDCEVILRPDDCGALSSANLNATTGLATINIPLELAEGLRRIISVKLVEMCKEEDLDFQLASREVIVFLGRLDRILGDLECACRQWEHGVGGDLDDGDAVILQFQVTPTTTARLVWQITPSEPLVLEHAYPNRVELVQDGVTSIVDSNCCDPPCLRSLWSTVVVHLDQNMDR